MTTPPQPTRAGRHPMARVLATVLALATAATVLLTAAGPAVAGTCAEEGDPPFTDVPVGHPFCREIANAASDGWVAGYPDGTFQPAATITRQAAAAMLWRADNGGAPAAPQACTAASPSGFTDVPNDHPFCGHIRDMALAGVFEGYPDGTFRPAHTITRQAVAVALVRFRYAGGGDYGLPPCAVGPFSDVGADHPFCAEIKYLFDAGVTNGYYPEASYHPGWAISRQGFVTQLYRLLNI